MVLLEPDPYVLCPTCRRLNFLKDGDIQSLECCGCRTEHTFLPEEIFPIIAPKAEDERYRYGKHARRYTIYLIINTHNWMIYVGMTTQSLFDRKYNHECSSNKLTPKSLKVNQAMAEFGHQAFQMILLEEALGQWKENRECYYIRRFDTNNPEKGYNRTRCRTPEEIEAYINRIREEYSSRNHNE
jgi:hypothetical protein